MTAENNPTTTKEPNEKTHTTPQVKRSIQEAQEVKFVYPVFAGLVITLLNLIAPVLALFAVPFIKWDTAPTFDRHGRDETIRGDLPGWLSWLSTPDERLPGGLYEPAHKALLEKWGRGFASWYWIGIRNALMGLSKAAGQETTGYATDEPGYWTRGELWKLRLDLGTFRMIIGYKVYRLLDGRYWAYPCATINHRPG